MNDYATNTVETLSGRVDLSAGGRSVTLTGGQGSKVRVNGRPTPPRPLPEEPAVPALEPIYRTLPLLINSPAHKTARQIRLRVTADGEGQATLLEQAAAPGGRFNLSGLADGAYFARFTAIDAEGYESRPAGPLSLKIRTVPAAPLVAAPRNGATVWERRVRVEWLASEHASQYRLQVAADGDFQQIVDERTVDEAGATTAELPLGTYHLRVQALTADGFATLFSTPVTCTVAEQPQMAGMEATSKDKATLQWAPMAEGWTYDLQVATDKAFTRLVVDRTDLTATSLTLEDRLDPGTYHVRLRGVEKGEPATPWTPPQTMTVKRSLGWEDGLPAVILIGLLLL
jgi:predicted phage tail protein